MSKYSGKCDLYDFLDRWDGESHIDVYIFHNGKRVKVDVQSRKDVVPYYPFICAIASNNLYILSSESYVDEREKEMIEYAVKEVNRYKRKKKLDEYKPYGKIEQAILEKIKNGDKNFDDVHYDFFDKYYRTNLAQEMSENGYDDFFINEWVFGNRKYDWRANNDYTVQG